MHVVVLGAGLARLSAAYELSRSGVRVTVLEEEAHVGGWAHAWRSKPCWLDHGSHRFYSRDDDRMHHFCAVLDDEVVVRERRSRIHDDPYRVVRCANCAHVYVTPRSAENERVPSVYDASYWSSASPRRCGHHDYLASGPLYARTFERCADVIDRWFPHPGRALDVGCAAVDFLRVLVARAGAPLSLLFGRGLYVNLSDEMIVIAGKQPIASTAARCAV